MQRHDPNSVSTAGTATAQGPAAAIKITRILPSHKESPSPLLAQIPDLTEDDPEELIEEHTTAANGRLISQSLASKLVLGGGILLVAAAILPFMFLRTAPQPAGNELSAFHPSVPAPTADTAPPWNSPAAANAGMSTAVPAGPPSVVVPAVPAGPGGSNVAPPALTGSGPPAPNMPANMPPTVNFNQAMTLGSRPANGVPPGTAPPAANGPNGYRPGSTADYRGGVAPGNRSLSPYDARQNAPPGDPRQYQADSRSDYRREYRSDYRGNYPAADPAGVNPLMPDLNGELAPQGNPADKAPDASQGQSSQPGVAEFQGGVTAAPPNRN
jgi:hypothetical protein